MYLNYKLLAIYVINSTENVENTFVFVKGHVIFDRFFICMYCQKHFREIFCFCNDIRKKLVFM